MKIQFYLISSVLISLISCDSPVANKADLPNKKDPIVDTLASKVKNIKKDKKEEALEFPLLNEENAIDFFFNYNNDLSETKVRLETNFGNITIELFDDVPYHKANFIYLTKRGYFNHTYFHRIVKGFIIQGGNADTDEVAKKRRAIGRYLLPPDTRKGHKHHRGVISMPSSAINNPHKLASPFEFFIVVTQPGSYHLDGGYTPFGRVIEGMDVVDQINIQEVDNGDWPMKNIIINNAVAF